MVAGSCRQPCCHMPTMLLPYASNLAGGCRLLDIYTITNIMILRIVIILFLKLKDIKKLAFSWR